MSGFQYRRNIDGSSQSPTNLSLVGKNSIVFQVGDLIRVSNAGFAALVVTGDLVLGVVTGVTDANGSPVAPDSGTTDTYTMASDNQTVAGKKVFYIPALANYLWYNTADSAITATNLFQYMAVNDENDVDPGTVSDTTVDTVRLIQLDPDGTGVTGAGLFQIVESFWAQNGGGTVDTSGIEA